MSETKCICGAYRYMGAKHEARCPSAAEPPGRHTLEDPGISFTRVRFLEGQGPPQIDSYQPDGTPSEIVVGKLRCTFLGTRTIETTYGAGLVADVEILNDGDLAGQECLLLLHLHAGKAHCPGCERGRNRDIEAPATRQHGAGKRINTRWTFSSPSQAVIDRQTQARPLLRASQEARTSDLVS